MEHVAHGSSSGSSTSPGSQHAHAHGLTHGHGHGHGTSDAFFLSSPGHPAQPRHGGHGDHGGQDDVDAMIHSALRAYTGASGEGSGTDDARGGSIGVGEAGAGAAADHLALVRAATLGGGGGGQAAANGQEHAGDGAAEEQEPQYLPPLPVPPPFDPSAAASPAPAPALGPVSAAAVRPGRGPGSRARWTAAEDAHLVSLVRVVPPLTWNEIGETMARPPTGCSMRWYKFLRDKVARGEDVGSGAQTSGESGANSTSTNKDDELHPSDEMVVGGSGGAVQGEQALQVHDHSDAASSASGTPTATSNGLPVGIKRSARKAVLAATTGRVVPLESVPPSSLPPALPPSETLPGHPFPLKEGTKLHSNAGKGYLPADALVANPPVPFQPHTVLRGRRTQAAVPLSGDAVQLDPALGVGGAASLSPDGGVSPGLAAPGAKKGGKGSKGGLSKAGASVHVCPAENCKAAFKRSEHLRRHYKSVHRGEKPFPCTVAGCGKTFSRKDNLQQHQAMVHLVRALYTYPDGSTSTDPPEAGTPAAEGVTVTFEEVDVTRAARAGGSGKDAGGSRARKSGAGGGVPQGLRGVVPAAANYSVAPSASPGVEGEGDADGAAEQHLHRAGAGGGEKRARSSAAASGGDDDDGAAASDEGRIDKRLRLTGLDGPSADQLDPALQVLAARAQSPSPVPQAHEGQSADGGAARSITPSQAFSMPGAVAHAHIAGGVGQQTSAQYYAALARQLQLRRGSAGEVDADEHAEGDMLVDAGLPEGLFVPGLEAFLNGNGVEAHQGEGAVRRMG